MDILGFRRHEFKLLLSYGNPWRERGVILIKPLYKYLTYLGNPPRVIIG